MKIEKTINLVLIVICVVLAYFAFLRPDPDYRKKMRELDEANTRLKNERDSINTIIKHLDNDYTKLKNKSDSLAKEVSSLETEVEKKKKDAERSKEDLLKIKKELDETLRKIKQIKQNPPNRTGDDLINSLKIKTKQ